MRTLLFLLLVLALVPQAAWPQQLPPPRRTDTQTHRRDSHMPLERWPGSHPIPGLDTRFKVGGFVEVDFLSDSGAIASKGQFVTAAIATANAPSAPSRRINVSVSPTRLYLETRTPLGGRLLTTYWSGDFYRDGLGLQPEPRVRQAYVQMSDILFGGDVLVGQDWSSMADLEAFPNVLDFQGPSSFLGNRVVLARWSKGLAPHLKLVISAESPQNHVVEGGATRTGWPDGVLSITWDRPALLLMGTVVGRDLRASMDNRPSRAALGWGTSLSGRVAIPRTDDVATFSVSYGRGLGSDFNDQPPDAVLSGDRLLPIPAVGWYLSYQHAWTRELSSTLSYGALDASTLPQQAPASFSQSRYASANLVWTPGAHLLIGIEGLWGKRVDRNGADGTDFRTQVTTRYSF